MFLRKQFLKQNNHINAIYYIIVIMLYILTALYYGFIPGWSVPSLGLNFNMSGFMWDCSFTTSFSTLYPKGCQLTEGFIYAVFGMLFRPFFSSPMDLLVFAYFIIFSLSYISLIILLDKLLQNKFLSLFGIVFFYQNQFFINSIDIPQVGVAGMLISTSLLCDYLIYTYINESKLSIKTIIIIQFARIFLALSGSYVAVIFSFTTCFFSFIIIVIDFINKDITVIKTELRILFFNMLTWIIALSIMYLLTPRGVNSFSSDLNFLSGCSVDFVTLFLPNPEIIISKIIPSWSSLINNNRQLYGDSTMWNNYLGLGYIVIFIWSFFKKKKSKQKALIALIFFSLILSLGPYFKTLSTYSYKGILEYNANTNNMFMFPWASLFTIFPLKLMRAVYRWSLISHICLILYFLIEIKKIWNQKKLHKILTIAILFFVIFEFYPSTGITNRIKLTHELYIQSENVNKNVVEPLRKYINPSDIISIHTNGENGYLIPYIMSQLNCHSYEGGGDKAIELAKPSTPEIILSFDNAKTKKEIVDYIYEIDINNLCDWVIIPYFNVRWDSYRFPNSNSSSIINSSYFAKELSDSLEDNFELYYEDYFLLVKMHEYNYYKLSSNWTNLQENIIQDHYNPSEDYIYITGCYEYEKSNQGRWCTNNTNIILNTYNSDVLKLEIYTDINNINTNTPKIYLYINDDLVDYCNVQAGLQTLEFDIKNYNSIHNNIHIISNFSLLQKEDKRELSYIIRKITLY